MLTTAYGITWLEGAMMVAAALSLIGLLIAVVGFGIEIQEKWKRCRRTKEKP